MPAESELNTALIGDADVTNLVGEKVFSDIPGEGVSDPFVFFERLDTEIINTIHGGPPVAEISQMAVVCYARTRELAEQIGDACLSAAIDAGFIYQGRQGEYDDDSKLFAAAIQLQHNK